ncbi:hypothetical protein [Paenilisteria rocourtiae]|uniref:BH0509 protein n=1 Tax=Listeria rocourtiae TaxID=647910 RepID=A0A4R6ZND8_9LIST|nr:hypothetical protein [Listeria rocourtiae]TDR53918.1 hypothetical protein DFP96_10312 [Listeria rocourtiae]
MTEDKLTEKEREKYIAFLVWAAEEVQGVEVCKTDFMRLTDTALVEEVDWYDYLLDK